MLAALDVKAVRLLMRRGRATWAELAQHLKLSAPAAAERVRRLEERGVIRGYGALVDPAAAGHPLTAFIAVSLERPRDTTDFLRRVGRLPAIVECHHVAGEWDYLLKARCRDAADLDRLLNLGLKGRRGIARTHTTIVLSTSKETHEVPILEGT